MPRAAYCSVGHEPFPGYRLTRRLGAGGFGEVWEATTPTGRPIALKFLPCGNGRSAVREIRSLQAIRQLVHPHLIEIKGVWCYSDQVVVGMELAEGSLSDLYAAYQAQHGTPIAPEHLCLLLADAAEALDFLNARQHHINGNTVAIQHCDVKPSNLLLIGESLKVADFGLSSWLSSGAETRGRCGTLDYCAPEVFRGVLAKQTDQYALAVTYCEMRGGRLPFHDTPDSFQASYARPHPDLSMLPAAEEPIVRRALNQTPLDRYTSCSEFIDRLIEVVSAEAHGPGTKSGPPIRSQVWT